MLALKYLHQSHHEKNIQVIDTPEFRIFTSINKFFIDLINTKFNNNPNIEMKLRNLLFEKYSPILMKVITDISIEKPNLENKLERNELFWIRSLLCLDPNNSLIKILATENIKTQLNKEIELILKTSLQVQMHDSFYKLGILLQCLTFLDINKLDQLSYFFNYGSLQVKKYFKYDDLSHKFFNAFRFSVEISMNYHENFDGTLIEKFKNLDYKKFIPSFLNELQSCLNKINTKTLRKVVDLLGIAVKRLQNTQDKLSLTEILFTLHLKFRALSENLPQMIGSDIAGQENKDVPKNFSTFSKILKGTLFDIMDLKNYHGYRESIQFSSSLAYSTIIHIFYSLSDEKKISNGGVLSRNFGHHLILSDNLSDYQKEMANYECYILRFFYKMVKSFNSPDLFDLLHNIISSRYSIKLSLSKLKDPKNPDSKTHLTILKLLLKLVCKRPDTKIFKKAINELMVFFYECTLEAKFDMQHHFMKRILKKVVASINDSNNLSSLFVSFSGFLINIVQDVLEQKKDIHFLNNFLQNLPFATEILNKIYSINKDKTTELDQRTIEKIMELWIYITLNRDFLVIQHSTEIKEFAFLTPNLIQISGKSYTNLFLIHYLLNSQKFIDKYKRSYKHILREKMIELRPRIRNLTLGEMVYCMVVDYILDAKLEIIKIKYETFADTFGDISFMDNVLCYIRDIYINEKEFLKDVLEEIVSRKIKIYRTIILNLNYNSNTDKIEVICKDFIKLLQGSCCINNIYSRVCQTHLKEFIKDFPFLIFQRNAITTIVQILDFLRKKMTLQYDSVSSHLQLKDDNDKISLPTNMKEISNLIIFFISCLYSMLLRGYLIDSVYIKTKIQEISSEILYSSNGFGFKLINYFLSTFKPQPSWFSEQNFKSNYAGYWITDKALFQKRVESFENKLIDESIRPLTNLSVNSAEITTDSKITLNSLFYVIKTEDTLNSQDYDLYKERSKIFNYEEVLNEFMHSFLPLLFFYNILLRERKYANSISELIKSSNYFDIIREIKDLQEIKKKKPKIYFETLSERYQMAYNSSIKCLNALQHIIIKNPKLVYPILSSLFLALIELPYRKLIKYLFKTFMRSIIIGLDRKHLPEILFCVQFFLKKLIENMNKYCNIHNPQSKNNFQNQLFEIRSELFSSLLSFDGKERSKAFYNIYDKCINNYATLTKLENQRPQNFQNIIISQNFTQIFPEMHRNVLKFILTMLPVLLTNGIKSNSIFIILQENFKLANCYMEKLNMDNIYYFLLISLQCISLMKNSPKKSEEAITKLFYYGTLKFTLNNFCRNQNFYFGDVYDCKKNSKKASRKIDLGLLTCKFLKSENYMESGENLTHDDLFGTNEVCYELDHEGKRNIFGSKTLVTLKETRDFWFIKSIKSTILGNISPIYWHINISNHVDTEVERKLHFSLIVVNTANNLKKLLLLLIQNELDCLKAFYRNELQFAKTEFTLEDKTIYENEMKPLIYSALDINANLLIYMQKKMNYLFVGNYSLSILIRDLIQKNALFYFKTPQTFDFYVEKNLEKYEFIKLIFYWDTPHIPTLFKYITLEYDKQRTMHVYFCKTMKRLESEQLLFYLPQIFQILNTSASFMIKKFLIDYSQTSFLFCHQLIWKSKVESKIEKEHGQQQQQPQATKLSIYAKNILQTAFKNMSKVEKNIFNDVNDFFEQITGISGILRPKQPKAEKKEIIKTRLSEINVNELLYIPCNPYYRIVKIKLDSGTPMQSAAKCPILVSFYCQKFEGPDKYYQQLVKPQKSEKANLVSPETTRFEENIGEDIPNTILKESSVVKLFPKELGFIVGQKKDNTSVSNPVKDDKNIQNSEIIEFEKNDQEIHTLADEEFISGYQNEIKKRNQPEFLQSPPSLRFDQYFTVSLRPTLKTDIKKFNDIKSGSNIMALDTKSLKGSLIAEDHKGKNIQIKDEEKEKPLEIISCIFKVFDDIRQDNLALQIIKLFQHIFQSVGLDLFLNPYRTISNRTGNGLDIGGIIEVVPNTVSRDQLGKTHECNLYEYFINKFGNEISPEFQLARENFIKSMAAYSIVSYILQIKDRHNGNILIDGYGHLIHIDFGFIFDISPANNLRFESANFKLTKEMIQIMGGAVDSEPFNYYVDQTIKAFLAVRRYEEHIVNLIKLMTYSGLKCFRDKGLKAFKERFFGGKNDLSAANQMKKIIYDAYDKLTTNIYDDIQHLQNGIYR